MRKLCLHLFVLFALPAAAAEGGHWVGNGGDSLAMGILWRTRELHDEFLQLNEACRARLKLPRETFTEIVGKLQINTTPDPLHVLDSKGVSVFKEALNFPEQSLILFNRDAYRVTESKDQLIIHELLGLAGIGDPQYRETQLIHLSLHRPECREESAPPPQPAEAGGIPYQVVTDQVGILYFLVAGQAKIHRYSLSERRHLTPLTVRAEPRAIAVTADGRRVYVAHSGRQITVVDSERSASERPFAQAELGLSKFVHADDVERFRRSEISALHLVGQSLVVVPGGSQQWMNLAVYNPAGQRVGQSSWVSPFVAAAPDALGRGLFFISGWSPRDLNLFPVRPGHYELHPAEVDSPYHGEHRMNGPLAVSPAYVALGSGNIFTAAKMEFVADLREEFDSAVWRGSILYTGKALSSGFIIEGRQAPAFGSVFKRTFDHGALIGIFTVRKKLVCVWTTADGVVRFDEIQAEQREGK